MIFPIGMAEAGFSLIEVLISALLLALMLLGLDAMQVTTTQEAVTAYEVAAGTQQLQNMAELLVSVPNSNTNDLLLEWNHQNRDVLPQGTGRLSGAYPHYQLNISWGATPNSACLKSKIGKAGCLQENLTILA